MPPKGQNLVNLESVTAHVPGDASRVLLDAVSLGVERGERVGVVGLNGGGKTTLLDVLTGERAPDGGRVSRVGGLHMTHLAQRDTLAPGATVRDVVLAAWKGAANHEWAADAKVRDVLDGLGIADLDRPVDGLSGGEKRRVSLAAALVGEPDLVVLDEPTNHLDVEGIGWLARHLLSRRCAVVVVTHDRWFLDAVCTRTWEVANGRVESYLGGYADWVYARAERTRQSDAAEPKRQNLARKELAWLRRGPPARTSKPRYRIEAAEALIADVPPPRNTVELLGFATNRLGKTVLELEDATVRIGGRVLLDHVTWRLGPGDRIGIVGVNGSGKTTLLRSLTGERQLDGGRLITGTTVQLAELTQELVDLPGHLRVLEATEEVAKYVRFGKMELTASSVLERLGFPAAAAVDAGRRAVRRRAAPAAAHAAADGRAERAAARRAHQRPRRRHPLPPGGPARRLAGHAHRRQPRPVPRRAGLRHGRRAARRREDHPPARRHRGVPADPGGAGLRSGRSRGHVHAHGAAAHRRAPPSSGPPARSCPGWSGG